MIVFDLILICLISILLEYKLLKRKYMLFSPFTIFNVSFFVVYILPLVIFKLYPENSYLSNVTLDMLIRGYNFIRVFYYSWFILSISFFLRIRHFNIISIKGFKKPPLKYLLFVWLFMFTLYFVALSAPLGFNPISTFNRMINPRAYTFIRAGFGPLNHILSALKLIMLILSSYIFFAKKKVGSFLLVIISILINILGGSKASFLNFIIVFALISFKMDFSYRKIKLKKLIKYGIFGVSMLIIAFMVFYKPGEVISINEAFVGLRGYQKEAYYTIKVINDFDWKSNYLFEGIIDTITPFIPRAIWSDKPFSGFYQRYWRATYEPNTVIYHTSTFGALSESYMMFNIFGSVLYAFLFFIICKKTYLYYQKTNTFLGAFVVSYILSSMYFFVRSGLFSSTVVAFLYQVFIAYFLLNFLQKFFRKNKAHSENAYTKKKI